MRNSFSTSLSFVFIFVVAGLVFSFHATALEAETPDQLFDINLSISDTTIQNSDELNAHVVFVSFGKVPTPVDATFTIFDVNGNQVHMERDSIIVETEIVLDKQFKGLTLKPGKYTLALDTLYNGSVRDEFEKKFEIMEKGRSIVFWMPQLWIFIVILTVVAAIVFYYILNPKNEESMPLSNVIRTVDDSRMINNIMIVNRFIVLAAGSLFIYVTWILGIIRFDPLVALVAIVPAVAVANGLWLWHYRAQRKRMQSDAEQIKNVRFYFSAQIMIDAGLILAAVYYTGKLYSDFLFLPVIVLSLAALVSWRLSLLAFAASVGFYFFLFFWQVWGLSWQEILYSLGGLNGMKFIRILIFAFMGVLISFVVSYFIKEIRRRNNEVEDMKRKAYSKVIMGLCDPLIAIRWIIEELDKRELIARNPELEKNIDILRQFEKESSDVVEKSLNVLDGDFFSQKL